MRLCLFPAVLRTTLEHEIEPRSNAAVDLNDDIKCLDLYIFPIKGGEEGK